MIFSKRESFPIPIFEHKMYMIGYRLLVLITTSRKDYYASASYNPNTQINLYKFHFNLYHFIIKWGHYKALFHEQAPHSTEHSPRLGYFWLKEECQRDSRAGKT